MKRQIFDSAETDERKVRLLQKLSILLTKSEAESFASFIGSCKEKHVVNTNPGLKTLILPGEFFEKQRCHGCDSCPHIIAIYIGTGKGCGKHSSTNVIWFLTEVDNEPMYTRDISFGVDEDAPWAIKI